MRTRGAQQQQEETVPQTATRSESVRDEAVPRRSGDDRVQLSDAPDPWGRLADLFDLGTRPTLATVLWVVLYVAALELGRLVDLPGSRVSLTWPVLGVTFLWLSPLVAEPRWWTHRVFWGSVLTIEVVTFITGYTRTPVLTLLSSGVTNAVQAVVATLLYLRLRPDRATGWERGSGSDLVRLFVAAVLGCLVGVPLLPLVGLWQGLLQPGDIPFWVLRNVANMVFFGVVGILFVGPQLRYAVLGLGVGRLPQYAAPGLSRARWYLTMTGSVGLLLVLAEMHAGSFLAFFVMAMGVASVSVMRVRQSLAYIMVICATLTALTVAGLGISGGEVAPRAAALHGTVVLVLIVGMALSLDRDQRFQLIGTIRTEQRAAAESARLLSSVVGSMKEGVVVLNADGDIAMRNPAAHRLLGGIGGRDLAALDWQTVAEGSSAVAAGESGADSEGARGGGSELRSDGGSTVAELTVRGAAGTGERILSLQATPLSRTGEQRSVAVVRDITEERRTLDDVRSFTRVAAHDLRTPLTAIHLWADTLELELGDSLHPGAVESLGHIRAAADRMDGFIADLLQYSLARDGQLHPDEVDVSDLVNDVVAGQLLGRSGPEPVIDIDVTERARSLEADATLLRLVLDNLVGNALKYVEPGRAAQVDITADVCPATAQSAATSREVCVGKCSRPGGDSTSGSPCDQIVIRVADRGIGLPAGEAEKVFEEFHRVSAHSERFPGTGLGLAIARRVVDRHAGTITAVSRPGGGTVMAVTLPRRAGQVG